MQVRDVLLRGGVGHRGGGAERQVLLGRDVDGHLVRGPRVHRGGGAGVLFERAAQGVPQGLKPEKGADHEKDVAGNHACGSGRAGAGGGADGGGDRGEGQPRGLLSGPERTRQGVDVDQGRAGTRTRAGVHDPAAGSGAGGRHLRHFHGRPEVLRLFRASGGREQDGVSSPQACRARR
ncbi:hypothetical protein SDC9_184080 [bioreactor metagenome]|uniref:Uncharacterized protein n=1 Tax=bioreactor metagenome TaxID=1076179 RepID=A0A645HC06_9ZZZZ